MLENTVAAAADRLRRLAKGEEVPLHIFVPLPSPDYSHNGLSRDVMDRQISGDRKLCADAFLAMPADPVLLMWQRFASYCRSCALSGEHDPDEFETFAARQKELSGT